MLNWRKRLPEWVAVIRWTHGRGMAIPWLKMALTVLQGPVPRAAWRLRVRTCLRCPLYRGDLRACSSVHPAFKGLGCQCNTTMLALFPEPYPGGCIARFWGEETMGWPAYRFPSVWARLLAPFRFLIGK